MMTAATENKIRSPLNNDLFLGYISKVTSRFCDVHFPNANLLRKFWHSGEEYVGGIVGNYVIIEGENHGFLGILQEIGLSENDIYSIDKEQSQQRHPFHPDGKIEVLLSFDFFDIAVKKGLDSFPIAGSKVYLCPKDFLHYLLSKADSKKADAQQTVFKFATLHNSLDTDFEITPNSLFERHCAVVGTTGGGKSYTIAQLLQQFIEMNQGKTKKQKAILIDATGEFHKFATLTEVDSLYFGNSVKYGQTSTQSNFHYSRLRISDILAILRPAGQVQRPKLMDAVKSLKIAEIIKPLVADEANRQIADMQFLYQIDVQNGVVCKKKHEKKPFEIAYAKYINQIEADAANFDITKLANQVIAECVWDNGPQWGDAQQTERGNVSSLVSRINHAVYEDSFNSVFRFQEPGAALDANEFSTRFAQFLTNDKSVLIISVESVSFEFGLREILINAIGRLLLEKARKSEFVMNPIVLFLDEAHQFLKKSVQDEYFAELELDAFDKISKECRKHGLYLCISTQMPRDIPDGTLSQMGTFIVHRLINEKDREKIQNACSEANKQSLSYLPILGEGVALLVSVNLPMPVLIKVKKPVREPDSKSPVLFSSPPAE